MTESPFDAENLRQQVQVNIDEFIATQRPMLASISSDTDSLINSLTQLLSGGKRLRPAFAYWGYRSTGAIGDDSIVRAATSLEFLQACALIHDDVMDASDTRRGLPATHRQFESLHVDSNLRGDAAQFGLGAAILIGDLALSWADEMLSRSGISTEQWLRVKPVYDVMRTELMAGQYLDLLEQQRGDADAQKIRNVIRYKSAKYTIERPLHLGASLAGATDAHMNVLSTFGLNLGEAFQLRDDVLGVFGEASVTGKPVGDDLREGKRTLLIAYAMENATPSQRSTLEALLGNPVINESEVREVQELLTSTEALKRVESDITTATNVALSALDSPLIDDTARDILHALAIAATQRAI